MYAGEEWPLDGYSVRPGMERIICEFCFDFTCYPLSGLIIIEATSSIQERMNLFVAWTGKAALVLTILWFAKRFFCEFAPLAVRIPFNLVRHVLPLSYFLMNWYNTK